MNLKKLYLLIITFFSIQVFSFFICEALNLVEEGYLTVVTNTPFEPWEYRSGEDVIGIDMDIARKIAEYMNLKLKINDVSFDALSIEITNKKCDLAMAAMSATDERRKSIDYSKPYFNANQAILTLKDSKIFSPDDLSCKKIGVQMGTTGDSYCSSRYSTTKYNNLVDAVEDLINGQVDAVVLDEFPAKRFEQKYSDKIRTVDKFLFTEQYRIAIQKGNFELLETVNAVIDKLQAENFVENKISEYSSRHEKNSIGFLDQLKLNLMDGNRYKQIISGILVTLKITIFSLIIGVFLGYLTAISILSKGKILFTKFLKVIAKFYVSIIRGTPVVCQLFIIYYLILSPLGANKILCAVIAFGINSGAYVSEIIRSGILSVDAGQIEAGKALGLNENQIMWHIIAPQALKNSLATLCNEFMQLIKETSVAGFIGVTELTRSGEIIRSQTLSPFVPLMTTALIYFLLVHLVGMLMAFFERRLRESDKS